MFDTPCSYCCNFLLRFIHHGMKLVNYRLLSRVSSDTMMIWLSVVITCAYTPAQTQKQSLLYDVLISSIGF